jgi:peptide/nickel transport system permease protein
MKLEEKKTEEKGVAPKPSAFGEMKVSLKARLKGMRYSFFLLRKSKLSLIGMMIVIALVIVAIFAPLLATLFLPHDLIPSPTADPLRIPRNYSVSMPLPPGTPGHPLGTGTYEQDIYYGLIWGSQVSMKIAIVVVGIGALVGIILGALAGYFGGVIDEILMRITDVFLSVPGLILAMAVVVVLGPGLDNIMYAFIIVWWPGYARLIRGQVLSIRENAYIEAARAVGAGSLRIIRSHILPNSWAPMLVNATMDMGTIVLVTAGLSYIGFGANPGTAEWGRMVSDGQYYFIHGSWWMVFFPGMAIMIFVLGFNLMGDGLRDILDPKLRK